MSSHHPSSIVSPSVSSFSVNSRSPASTSSSSSSSYRSSSSSNIHSPKDNIIKQAVYSSSANDNHHRHHHQHQQHEQQKVSTSTVNKMSQSPSDCEYNKVNTDQSESIKVITPIMVNESKPNTGEMQSNKIVDEISSSLTIVESKINLKSANDKEPRKRHRVGFGEIITRKLSTTSWMNRESGMSISDDDRRGSDLMRFFTRRRSHSPTLINPVNCQRLHQPRLSLLGRPIICKPIKQRDPRYRRTQVIIHNFLERPRGKFAIFYHLSQ